MLRTLLAAALLLAPLPAQAGWKRIDLPRDVTLRAVATLGAGTVQVSGAKGTYAVSEDGGRTWRFAAPPEGAELDFRGLAALDAKTTVLMSAGEGPKGQAKLFRTADGGRSWTAVFETSLPGSFLDTVAFRNGRVGYVLGDPIDGRWFLLRTQDGGRTWRRLPGPPVQPGEAAFAASNSALFLGERSDVWIVSGGLSKGRVHHSADDGGTWTVAETPLAASGSAGLFGGLSLGGGRAVVVGGDYKDELADMPSIALGDGSGWRLAPHAGTPRLLEGVGRLDARTLLAVGPRGSSISEDDGRTWRQTDTEAFHAIACRVGTCVAAGGKGHVGIWVGE